MADFREQKSDDHRDFLVGKIVMAGMQRSDADRNKYMRDLMTDYHRDDKVFDFLSSYGQINMQQGLFEGNSFYRDLKTVLSGMEAAAPDAESKASYAGLSSEVTKLWGRDFTVKMMQSNLDVIDQTQRFLESNDKVLVEFGGVMKREIEAAAAKSGQQQLKGQFKPTYR